MRLKSWLSAMFQSIARQVRVRPNRRTRRLRDSRARSLRRLMAAAALTPVLAASAAGQCVGPLFPGQHSRQGDRPSSVTTGDFNGDGLTDLATAKQVFR